MVVFLSAGASSFLVAGVIILNSGLEHWLLDQFSPATTTVCHPNALSYELPNSLHELMERSHSPVTPIWAIASN